MSAGEPRTLFLTALTLEIVATFLLTVALMRTHRKMAQDRAIDEPVVFRLHEEAYIAYGALTLIVISFILIIVDEVLTYG